MVGFIGACYFLGFFVGSIFFPRLADIIGRKPVGLTGLFSFIIIVIAVTFSTNFIGLYVLMFLMGLRTPMNTQVVYIHLLEYVGERYRNRFATGLLVVDGLAAFWTPFYFVGVKNFLPLYYFAIALACVLFVLNIFLFPESARYYISHGQY